MFKKRYIFILCYCTTLSASAIAPWGQIHWIEKPFFLSPTVFLSYVCWRAAVEQQVSAFLQSTTPAVKASYSPFHCKLNYSLSTPEVLTRRKCNQPQIEPIADNRGICPAAPRRNPLKARRTCVSQQTFQLLTYWNVSGSKIGLKSIWFLSLPSRLKAHYCHTTHA